MSDPSFAHLHVHSEYSILDGACQISPLVARAAELGMEHIGLTDHGTMAGTVELYRQAREANINPVLGLEAYLTEDRHDRDGRNGRKPQTTHLTLLAADNEGWKNLIKLSSIGYLEGMYYKPRIDYDVMARHSRGVIALSGCLASCTCRHLADGNVAGARAEVDRLANIFGADNLYLEFQDAGIDEQKRVNELLLGIQKDTGLAAVVTADVHYLRHEDHKPHDALLCIQTGSKLADAKRLRFSTDQFYLKSPQEMYSEFTAAGYPAEWLHRSVEIAGRCKVELELGGALLPPFPVPDGKQTDAYLRELCEAGLRRRYEQLDGELEERLAFELGTISNMGYSAYFLITWDWITWAKQQGIAVGPGRGSAAGSLVAYTLGITDIDPMRYNLLFERFLNPDRVSMPDIDTDVSQNGRGRCIQYLAERYGRDHVAQIATFGRMAPKAALKDAARVMDFPPAVGDKVSKLVPEGPGASFEQCLGRGKELARAYGSDKVTRDIVDMARPLEGVVRNSSIHAAAVVIGDQPLTDIVPLRVGDKGEVVTQIAQDDVEALGLLKMDVLGLRNLDVLEKVATYIADSRGTDIDITTIPLDDAATYEMIARGDTTGVFQLESPGIQGAARQIRPTRFEDIVALNALYRPGPMEYIPKFAANKQDASRVRYDDPRLEPILSETYGITAYQEQYMLIARRLAGFTPGEADDLRKGIAKKKMDVLERIRPRFLEGCAKNGVAEHVALKLWDDMEKAGNYSFNKSHSVCYALIAYQTAWLKQHYPAEYMAALISTVMHTKDKVPFYVSACRNMNINVLPPDVNLSLSDFRVIGNDIRFGMSAVRGVGEQTVEAIVAERAERPYDSIWDFCERVDCSHVNKRVLEALIKAGAFDSTGVSRRGMLEAAAQAMAMGQRAQQDAAAGQFDLFAEAESNGNGDGGGMHREYPRIDTPEFDEREKLAHEKDVLGLYISGHPLEPIAEALAERVDNSIAQVASLGDKTPVVVGGMVTAVRQLVTRKGDPMAFVQLEDMESSVRVVVLPNLHEVARELLVIDEAVIVKGRVDARDGRLDLVADEISRVQDAPKLRTVTLVAREHELDEATVDEIARIVRNYPGESNVDFSVQTAGGVRRLRLGQQWRVSPDSSFYAEIRALLGDAGIA